MISEEWRDKRLLSFHPHVNKGKAGRFVNGRVKGDLGGFGLGWRGAREDFHAIENRLYRKMSFFTPLDVENYHANSRLANRGSR